MPWFLAIAVCAVAITVLVRATRRGEARIAGSADVGSGDYSVSIGSQFVFVTPIRSSQPPSWTVDAVTPTGQTVVPDVRIDKTSGRATYAFESPLPEGSKVHIDGNLAHVVRVP